jgi:CysZ protein
METLIDASFKAVRSLFAPGMFMILLKSLFITIFALIAFFTGASSLFFWLFGPDSWLSWLASFGAGVFAWFLFPAIMPVIVNFFDTRIVRTIEAQDYPGTPAAIEPPFMKEFFHDLRFTSKALLLNLIALPFYLIPVFNLILFYGLNGYLLGREFFVMVARQHMPIEQAILLHKSNKRLVTFGGTSLAVAATIPIINLFAPIWGIALMVHLYHRVEKPMEILPPQAKIIL